MQLTWQPADRAGYYCRRVETFERRMIRAVIRNRSTFRAALVLGVTPWTLRRRMAALGVQ